MKFYNVWASIVIRTFQLSEHTQVSMSEGSIVRNPHGAINHSGIATVTKYNYCQYLQLCINIFTVKSSD